MGLSQALSTAMSGLRATQASLCAGVVERRQCGNAGLRQEDDQPGRRRDRRLRLERSASTASTGSSISICRRNCARRRPARPMPTSARTFSPICRTSTAIRIDTGTIENCVQQAADRACRALSTSPDSQSARIGVVNAAQAMAQQLNATTQGIQSLRANAETRHQQFRHHRQQRDGADRGHQQSAAERAARPTRRPRRCSTSATSTSLSCRS